MIPCHSRDHEISPLCSFLRINHSILKSPCTWTVSRTGYEIIFVPLVHFVSHADQCMLQLFDPLLCGSCCSGKVLPELLPYWWQGLLTLHDITESTKPGQMWFSCFLENCSVFRFALAHTIRVHEGEPYSGAVWIPVGARTVALNMNIANILPQIWNRILNKCTTTTWCNYTGRSKLSFHDRLTGTVINKIIGLFKCCAPASGVCRCHLGPLHGFRFQFLKNSTEKSITVCM